jgi:ketopantoate reductase
VRQVIVGAVLKVARQSNIATPLLDFTYVLLKGVQVELLKQQKLKQEVPPL